MWTTEAVPLGTPICITNTIKKRTKGRRGQLQDLQYNKLSATFILCNKMFPDVSLFNAHCTTKKQVNKQGYNNAIDFTFRTYKKTSHNDWTRDTNGCLHHCNLQFLK